MKKHGFTLIELSIVLVIIGLLVGGVLVGRDLIHNAQLRKVMSEVNSLNTNVNTFRSKYDCIPGDCQKATTFWGAAATCPVVYWGGTASSPETCDGNNDGIVSGEEQFTFFAHLYNASLIKTPAYSAPCCSRFTAPTPNGLPSGVYTNNGQDGYGTGYSIVYMSGSSLGFTGVNAPRGDAFVREDGHNWLLGTTVQTNVTNYGPVMTSADAFNIDTKMDDGLPGKGTVKTWKSEQNFVSYWSSRSMPLCATTDNADTARYNIIAGGDSLNCSMLFRTQFN
jgi:prepilin-type N-terminal cleavage/methylation domain-containing protein